MMEIQEDPMFQQRWIMYREALRVGLPIVSLETCAIICAGLLVHGNNENFTHNHRLVCELKYAQERFNIKGGETPNDRKFLTALNFYTNLMELNYKRDQTVPDFINDLFKDRYGFYLLTNT